MSNPVPKLDPDPKPPHHADAEQAMLGALMMESDRLVPWMRAEGITEESFFYASNRELVGEIMAMHDAGQLVDPVTLPEHLKARGMFERVGGSLRLSTLIDACQTTAHAEHYGKLIREASMRRQVMAFAAEISLVAQDPDKDAAAAAHLGIEKLTQILRVRTTERGAMEILREQIEQWQQVHHGIKRMTGMSTGYMGIDRFTGGLQPRKMYVLGGRPSAGKTTLSLDMGMDLDDAFTQAAAADAINDALAQKIPVGFVAMDMPREDLLVRALCRRAGVSLSKLNFGFANDNDFAKLEGSLPSVAGLPFSFTHSRQLNVIRSCARMWKAKGMRLLVIDYLQQIQDDSRRFFGDTERVSHVSAAIKELSQELDLPILALAQLNRAVSREERAPRMDDFRDAGGIEQDASCAIILWNPHADTCNLQGYWSGDGVWHPDDKRTSWGIRPVKAEIVKQQNGPIGSVPLLLDSAYFNMRDLPRLRRVQNYFGHGPNGDLDDRHDNDRHEADLWWHHYNQRRAEE